MAAHAEFLQDRAAVAARFLRLRGSAQNQERQ
jgi:hypothetical protein